MQVLHDHEKYCIFKSTVIKSVHERNAQSFIKRHLLYIFSAILLQILIVCIPMQE